MASPLVFSADGGIGNRLRALVGLRVLAELEGEPLHVHWRINGACDTAFERLFDKHGWTDVRFIDDATAARCREDAPDRYIYTSAWFTEIWRERAMDRCSREVFCARALARLRALRPERSLGARISAFLTAHPLDAHVGVHVRMTDNVAAASWWSAHDPHFDARQSSTIAGFERALDRLAAANTPIFLCTDNARLGQALADRVPVLMRSDTRFSERGLTRHLRRISGTERRTDRWRDRLRWRLGLRRPSSFRTTSVGDAVIDLFLLARCRALIGTYYSSFGQVAALLGGKPLQRVVGEDLAEDRFVEDMNRIAQSGAVP